MMAVRTPCQTPGTQFHIHVGKDTVAIRLDLPPGVLNLTEDDATLLESNLHNALEQVLARYFNGGKYRSSRIRGSFRW
jgi:hypothetical protein